MRTPRLGSESSGETSGQSWAGGRLRACRGRRSAPSDRDPQVPSAPGSMFDGERRDRARAARRARDRRRIAIRRHDGQQRRRIRLVRPGGLECLGVGLEALPARPMPAFDRRRRPCGRLVAVTVVAGIGRAELHRQIGPRDAEAVIVPAIDHHVGARRHVAGRAGSAPGSPPRDGGARPRRTCRRRGIAGRRRRRARAAWRRAARGNRRRSRRPRTSCSA